MYEVAQRLESDYLQNKLMDSLMLTLRCVWDIGPVTWVLSKFESAQHARESPLAGFLCDYVAFRWLVLPSGELWQDPAARTAPVDIKMRRLVEVGNNYILVRLMLMILQMHAGAMTSGIHGQNPAFRNLCTYHVHREENEKKDGKPCPGKNV